jgi:hypothetical protein
MLGLYTTWWHEKLIVNNEGTVVACFMVAIIPGIGMENLRKTE